MKYLVSIRKGSLTSTKEYVADTAQAATSMAIREGQKDLSRAKKDGPVYVTTTYGSLSLEDLQSPEGLKLAKEMIQLSLKKHEQNCKGE